MFGFISFLICITIITFIFVASDYFSTIAKMKHEEEIEKINKDSDFAFIKSELNRYIEMYNELAAKTKWNDKKD